MELSQLIQIAIDFGITPLNLVLLGMLYVFMANSGQLPKFWEKKPVKSEAGEDKLPTLKTLDKKMSHLLLHFNDETTENLQTISKNQDDMKRGIEKISTKQDKIGDEITLIKNRQDSWHEYGIKIRKEV